MEPSSHPCVPKEPRDHPNNPPDAPKPHPKAPQNASKIHLGSPPGTRTEKSSLITLQRVPQGIPKSFQKAPQGGLYYPPGATPGCLPERFRRRQEPQDRPRIAPRRPRASQTLPKWSPRPSQFRFLSNFGACFVLVANLHVFFAVLWQNLFVF